MELLTIAAVCWSFFLVFDIRRQREEARLQREVLFYLGLQDKGIGISAKQIRKAVSMRLGREIGPLAVYLCLDRLREDGVIINFTAQLGDDLGTNVFTLNREARKDEMWDLK